MEEVKFTDLELETAKRMWGFSDEKMKEMIPKLRPYHKAFFAYKDSFINYQMIMEVVEVKNCPRQAILGGKMVFSAMGELEPSECTAFPVNGYCTLALMAMLPLSYTVSNRVMQGLKGADLTPAMDFLRCPHGMLEDGDLGYVRFKVYCIEGKQAGGHIAWLDGAVSQADSTEIRKLMKPKS